MMLADPLTFNNDGTPNVNHLESDTITVNGIEYMRRYFIHRTYDWSVQLHHLLTDDQERDPHDHPWDFASHLLTGAYRDHGPNGTVDYHAPCVVTRQAETPHRLQLLDGPMWTLVTCGPARRRWGFHTESGWVPWRTYRAADATATARPRPRARTPAPRPRRGARISRTNAR